MLLNTRVRSSLSKKKLLDNKIPSCRICKSDRGLVSKTKLCYKCLYNYLEETRFHY